MAAVNLAASSAGTVRGLLPRCRAPGPAPGAGWGSACSPMPGAQPGPAACRRLPAGRQPPSAPACPAAPGHARRSGRSRTRRRPAPRRRRVRPDCHHGHRSAQPVPAEPCLPVSLTGLALAHRPSQVTPHRLPQHRTARPSRAGLGCRLRQPASFCVFAGGCAASGRIDGEYRGTRHDLRLTTARQREGARGKRAVFRPPIVSPATAVLPARQRQRREHQLGRSRRAELRGWLVIATAK